MNGLIFISVMIMLIVVMGGYTLIMYFEVVSLRKQVKHLMNILEEQVHTVYTLNDSMRISAQTRDRLDAEEAA